MFSLIGAGWGEKGTKGAIPHNVLREEDIEPSKGGYSEGMFGAKSTLHIGQMGGSCGPTYFWVKKVAKIMIFGSIFNYFT